MSSVLSSLKLVSAKRNSGGDVALSRRHKLSQRIREQIAMATAFKAGDTFTGKRLRNVRDEDSGLKQAKEVAVRVKEWWFFNGGKVCVQLRYGNRVLPLSVKGDKNGVEVETAEEMIAVLTKLDAAVLAGELDAQMQTVSSSIRTRLKH
jgi:hypothetical protein